MSVSVTSIILVPGNKEVLDDTILISKSLYHQLNLANEGPLKVTLGKKTIEATFKITEQSQDELVLSEHIFQKFLLPIRKFKFQAFYQRDTHILQLGPIISLLTDFRVKRGEEPDFRSVHLFCEELHHGIENTGGFFYVFSYHDFPDKGYYFADGKWEEAHLPMPDVIYNRVHSRRQEHLKAFKQFRKQIAQLKIPIFNDRFLSKWEVYELLHKENHLYPYIPETTLFSYESLNDFAEQYETIYIKPVHGSQGRNIFKISRIDSNRYTYQTTLPSKTNEFPTSRSLDDLFQHLKPILGNRIYIVQQGIPLADYDGSVMDFRVLCHRSGVDDWKVTSLVARISAEEEIVSNLAKGGTVLRPLQALLSCMDYKKARSTIRIMKELSTAIAAAISKYTSGITGELGVDIGVDLSGKLWLIEVNSKPSKSFEDGQVKIRPSAKAIIELCRLLTFDSGFDKEES